MDWSEHNSPLSLRDIQVTDTFWKNEMALVRLYELTGEQKYLDLSRFFIDERGRRPYYFDKEHPEGILPGHEEDLRYEYNQAHLPVRGQPEAVGHAVRAVYLYSGMADVARLTRDEELYKACERLWEDIVTRKMYVTGGIGSTHLGEAFTFAYDLPNDTAYAETCASIGLVFFSRRMLEIRPQSKYADMMERALYNGILSGMALDGKSFFYVNPLDVDPEACRRDERKFHVRPVRQKWFGCACCPPNIARLLSSIASYAYTETEDTLFVHLYIGGTITKHMSAPQSNTTIQADHTKHPAADSEAHVFIDSAFPWDGTVGIRVQAKGTPFRLALRIPDWAVQTVSEFPESDTSQTDSFKAANRPADAVPERSSADTGSLSAGQAYIRQLCDICRITGLTAVQTEYQDGYLYITKTWNEEDVIELHFPMDVKLIAADTKIREDVGRVAVSRGPIVYCLEESDNGRDLHLLTLNPYAAPEVSDISICGEPAKTILWPGFRQEPAVPQNTVLYHPWEKPEKEAVTLKFIPYYMWANRSGEDGAEMQVWTRIKE